MQKRLVSAFYDVDAWLFCGGSFCVAEYHTRRCDRVLAVRSEASVRVSTSSAGGGSVTKTTTASRVGSSPSAGAGALVELLERMNQQFCPMTACVLVSLVEY